MVEFPSESLSSRTATESEVTEEQWMSSLTGSRSGIYVLESAPTKFWTSLLTGLWFLSLKKKGKEEKTAREKGEVELDYF